MPKFKKKRARTAAKIETSALPDIIFMLLFFFMVATVLRNSKLMLRIVLPEVSETQKLEHRSLINHIYIGPPILPAHGTAPRIQINDAFINVEDIQTAMKTLNAPRPESLLPLVTTNLKIDKEVNMGIVSDVKTELRKARQLKVNYASLPAW
ncbi:MAG: biopolymer transporter ExbD [Bacteroidota bacterium]